MKTSFQKASLFGLGIISIFCSTNCIKKKEGTETTNVAVDCPPRSVEIDGQCVNAVPLYEWLLPATGNILYSRCGESEIQHPTCPDRELLASGYAFQRLGFYVIPVPTTVDKYMKAPLNTFLTPVYRKLDSNKKFHTLDVIPQETPIFFGLTSSKNGSLTLRKYKNSVTGAVGYSVVDDDATFSTGDWKPVTADGSQAQFQVFKAP